jgi:DNA-binding transcriptional MerR regulator
MQPFGLRGKWRFTMDTQSIITAEIEAIANSPLLSVEDLPEMELYVEQMTSYLEERLGDTLRAEDERIITKPMVNNYVKDGLIPRPKNRKYGREHLIPLMFICFLKQSLSFQEIKTALSLSPGTEDQKEAYAHFVQLVNDYRSTYAEAQSARIARIRAAVGEDATQDELALLYVTLTSLEAAADKLLCARILKRLQENADKKPNTPIAED